MVRFDRYVAHFAGWLVLICAVVVAINVVVDPLWYFEGNRLGGRNFGFDERLAKTNRLRAQEQVPGCLVFGSSRVTLLDEGAVGEPACFNYAFSNGTIEEFVEFAAYVRSLGGAPPELVVVGVDGFNFIDHDLVQTVPAFVREGGDPPSFMTKYLSLDALEFSLRVVTERTGYKRYYDDAFRARVMPTAGRFEPPAVFDPADRFGGLSAGDTNRAGPFDVDRTREFVRLREETRAARYVGYVPPLSASFIDHLDRSGRLEGYLERLHAAARAFDVLLDFSVPSEMTTDPANTYDGSHFREASNALVAEGISRGESEFALPVHAISLSAYRDAYRAALREYRAAREG